MQLVGFVFKGLVATYRDTEAARYKNKHFKVTS